MKDAGAVYARTFREREPRRYDLFVGLHESSSALRLMAASSVWRFSAGAGVNVPEVITPNSIGQLEQFVEIIRDEQHAHTFRDHAFDLTSRLGFRSNIDACRRLVEHQKRGSSDGRARQQHLLRIATAEFRRQFVRDWAGEFGTARSPARRSRPSASA